MRRFFSFDGSFPPILLPICGALLALALTNGPVRAQSGPDPDRNTTRTIYISEKDGYGLMDCLKSGGPCARKVANSWCEINGLRRATAWGHTDDFTGSTGGPAQKVPKDHLAVTCQR